ncbi:MAG TPA: YjzC family protein [Oscillatoriaceae cyanobacterium]
MANEEFTGELPATEEQTQFKTGEHVPDDGAYACVNCGKPWKEAPMVNLKKGDMIPVCSDCGPLSRWVKV